MNRWVEIKQSKYSCTAGIQTSSQPAANGSYTNTHENTHLTTHRHKTPTHSPNTHILCCAVARVVKVRSPFMGVENKGLNVILDAKVLL